jgi:hypothetical protein
VFIILSRTAFFQEYNVQEHNYSATGFIPVVIYANALEYFKLHTSHKMTHHHDALFLIKAFLDFSFCPSPFEAVISKSL